MTLRERREKLDALHLERTKLLCLNTIIEREELYGLNRQIAIVESTRPSDWPDGKTFVYGI